MLISYNTNWQVSTQLIPYYLMFERDLKIPIKEITLSEKTILDRVIKLIHKVSIFRKSAKEVIKKAQ